MYRGTQAADVSQVCPRLNNLEEKGNKLILVVLLGCAVLVQMENPD